MNVASAELDESLDEDEIARLAAADELMAKGKRLLHPQGGNQEQTARQ